MPTKPPHPCAHVGCHALTRERFCPAHHPTERPRPSAHQRGYTHRWAKASRAYLQEHPWCAQCEREGKRTPATEVDHIIPHKGNALLFWDIDNWQGLCTLCHSRKTAREDGGFGNGTPSPRPQNVLK